MNSIGNNALKAGAWYTICTFIIKGIAFLTMPFFARIMSTADIGTYSNLTSWVAILSGPVTLDLFTSINLAHFEFKEKISEYMSSIVFAGSVFTLFLYAVSSFFTPELSDIMGIDHYMFHVMFIYFLFYPAISTLHAKFRIYLQYKQTILTSSVPTVLSVVVSLILVLIFTDNKLKVRVFGYYGIWIFFALAIYVYVMVKGRVFKFSYVKFALPIALPLIIHTLANTLLSTSDRIMIKRFCGSEHTGMYSVAYTCATIVSILWTSINQAWAPWCFEMMHQNKEKEIGRIAKPILILFSLGVVLIILVAPEILWLIGGEKYLKAIYVIPPVMLGFVAQMLYTLYVNVESYNRKQKQIMIGTLIAAVFNIVLNAIFIPVFGYIAAAYTTLAGYILLLLIHYLFVRRMGKNGIYDMRLNMCILFGSIVLGIVSTMLYRYSVIRWSIFGIASIIAIVFFYKRRKGLVAAIKTRNIVQFFEILHLM